MAANTIASKVYREKYMKSTLDSLLRNALVAEKICQVDRSDSKTIENPYGDQPVVVVQPLAGTYAATEFHTTNDTLTVVDEFIVSEHIMDFQNVLSRVDLYASRMDEHMYGVKVKIDQYVLNNLLEDGTTSYTTPVGGFTTAANINTIMGELLSKVGGYQGIDNGLFLVIENTDMPGFVVAQATNGFSVADSALRNGFIASYMGVDIYVVRTGTFANATVGSTTYTNSGHRVFGVKGVATYAAPRGIQYEEKSVSGKTGMEIVTWGYIGFKLWATKASLIVDITIA